MDFTIPQEYQDLLASFRSFLDREARPLDERFAQELQEESLPEHVREEGRALRRRSAEAGFYNAYMPEEVGGGGLSNLGYTLLVEAGGQTGIRMATFALGPPSPEAPTPILMDLQPHVRDKYVPPLCRGETTMCFALTEPDTGSDAQNIRTRAVKDGEEWVLNGRKHFITNAPRADHALVFAVTDPEKKAAGGITAFWVDADTPGFVRGKNQKTMAGDTGTGEL